MGIVNFSIPKDLVLEIINERSFSNFVETGTFEGGTCFWAGKFFPRVFTIEISREISNRTAAKPDCPKNITFLVGNSKDVLPGLIPELTGRSFFWLDGHWCSGAGGKDEECPLMDELKAISKLKDPVIFIDDARCFLGPLPPPHNFSDWPTIVEIFSFFEENYPESYVTILDDVIVCVPADLKHIVFNYWMRTFNERFYSMGNSNDYGMITRLKSLAKRGLSMLKRKPEVNETADFGMTIIASYINRYKIKTVFDIGANEGQFAKKLRIAYPQVQIYSFEPLEEPYKKLLLNFLGDKSFSAYNVAIGDEDKVEIIHRNTFSPSSSILEMDDKHRINFPYTTDVDEERITVKRIGEIINVNTLDEPYLVKVDVQGYEDRVIGGNIDFFRHSSVVIVEVSFANLYKGQPLFEDIYKRMIGLGFSFGGHADQLISPLDSSILQADAIFYK